MKDKWYKIQRSKNSLRGIHYIQQNGVCAYCGETMNRKKRSRDDLSYTLEHIIPQRFGGLDSENNTICVCFGCNQKRSSLPLEWQMIVGIFLFKGMNGIHPIMTNLYIYGKYKLCVTTRHMQTAAITFLG